MDKEMMEFEANFSVLDRYGTDITKEEYITNPAIGRDQQIKELILVLLTPEKSAILIGKPGIGKTAIVEGLAYRIQNNDVPDALQGYTILNIKTASLLGTMPSGESKVQKMIDELKTKEKMILFIDEIHMLIGSTETSSLDFANIFKEGLGRGSIKVIGATTTEEYERYILRDKAFTRRFQKIEVPEPSRDETIQIMMGTLPKFEKQTGRKMKYTPFIQERIMSFIVDITSEYKRIFALGSRYPDVCLTLLKQAFSYTVYDNRPYMDIFDVRKAIENSKNIYPDVIKKELPNFDKMFNDILLEEKGDKPVEEWRKDGALTRSDLEEQKNAQTEEKIDKNESNIVQRNTKSKNYEEEKENDNLSVLENVPEMVDRLELRNSKPINNIISSTGKTKYAKVGSASVSTGLKEKLNRTTNSEVLDDLILSTDVGVLKIEQPKERSITNYVVTDEIRPGVDDDFLLGRPIESNMVQNEQNQEENVPVKYRGNQRNRKNEGKRMWNNNDYRPERQDINNQNFDRYQNFFHPENNMNNQNMENEKRIDMLINGSNGYNSNNFGNDMNNQMYGPMNNQMNGQMMNNPMNNQMYGPPVDMMNGQMMNNPMNNQMYGPPVDMMNGQMMNGPMNNQMYGPPVDMMNSQMMNGPMNNQMYGPPVDMMNGQMMNSPMNNQMYGPMPNQMDDPMKGLMKDSFDNPMSNSMNMPMPNQMNNPMNMPMGEPMPNPMTGPMNDPVSGLMNNPVPPQTIDNNPQVDLLKSNGDEKKESFFGAPMYDEDDSTSHGETLFGAPMYSEEETNTPSKEGEVDIYGQLIADNMTLKNGAIVNEFPTFDKLNNLSNITNSSTGQNMNPNLNNNMFGNQNMQMNPAPNKNWKYIDNTNNNMQMNMNNNSSFFQKNILDDVPKTKKDNNISLNENVTTPTNNKDYYEDMKSGDFVNFSDLSKGKVKEEDTNKYMGVQVEENKSQFDLNIENGSDDDNKFDDFYE